MTYEDRLLNFNIFIDQNTQEDVYFKDAAKLAAEAVALQQRAVIATLKHVGYSDMWADKYCRDNGYAPEPKIVVDVKAPLLDSCNFCGVTPFEWKGTCCASCGRSYRHG